MKSNYIKRKENEIKLLNKILNCNKINDKLEFNKYYKVKQQKKLTFPITKKDDILVKDYNYTYKRFDGAICIKNFAKDFYKIDYYNHNDTIFTNCGMSSITSLLLALYLLNYEIVMSDMCYFETYRMCSLFNKKSKNKILYLDTIENDFTLNLPSNISEYNIIIVDTTCFLPYEINELTKKLKEINKSIILVRSHTKLDLLGTEYTHIGSTVYFCDENMISEFDLIKEKQKLIISSNGTYLDILDFPYFMMNKKLVELNKFRIDTIRKNTEKLYFLSNETFELPNHKLFCLKKIYIENETLENLRKKLNKKLSKYNNIKYSVSFGLDYTAIDVYKTFVENEYVYRISPGDIDEKELKEQFKIIYEILK